jgi:D-glycero-D-manno-heptose 1,7-bisphosphate phosphatase
MREGGGQVAALFLDRDGVINRDAGYTHRIEDFHLLPGVVETLRWFQSKGSRIIVITNQAGIAKGYYSEEQFHTLTAHMRTLLGSSGIVVTDVLYCPHHPEGSIPAYATACSCRKPQPGMILEAAERHQIDLTRSCLVGDKPSDLEAGRRAGIRPESCFLVESNVGLDSFLRLYQSRQALPTG